MKYQLSITYRAIQYGLILCVVISALLIGYGLLHYTAPMDIPVQYLVYGLAGIALICVAAFIGIWSIHSHAPSLNIALQRGAMLGLIIAVIWAVNILWTHLLLANADKPIIGSLIVYATFAIIIVLTLGMSCYCAYQNRQMYAGIGLGLWSGLIGGVLTTIIMLFVLFIWMGFLTQHMNTNEIQAFMQSGVHDRIAWFFWEELTGSLGYLIINLMLGTSIGIIGGLIGKGLTLLNR